jgi:hypothetical protein
VVIDLHQVVGHDCLNGFAGQHDGHPIPKASQADRPALTHPPPHPSTAQIPTTLPGIGGRMPSHRRDGIHDLQIEVGGGQREPLGRRAHP